jgi:hypothetical protein
MVVVVVVVVMMMMMITIKVMSLRPFSGGKQPFNHHFPNFLLPVC